jgi:hypothetical protein
MGIWSAVRQMAGLTSVGLYRLVLEYKWPLLVRMTLEADRVLRRGSPDLLGRHRAVDVVAIAALDQALVYPMMEWHIELGFLLKMARVAKLWLRLNQ